MKLYIFRQLPWELEEAARVDGASRGQAFRLVLLPLAAPALFTTAIIGNVPVRRAGMAASLEEVSYEFGSLIAVSVLGSLLTAIYTASVVLY